MTVLFVIAVLTIIIYIICRICILRLHRHDHDETKVDGLENGQANGHAFRLNFLGNYNMRRKDSANKELLKKKNKNPVYKPTTQEMSDFDSDKPIVPV